MQAFPFLSRSKTLQFDWFKRSKKKSVVVYALSPLLAFLCRISFKSSGCVSVRFWRNFKVRKCNFLIILTNIVFFKYCTNKINIPAFHCLTNGTNILYVKTTLENCVRCIFKPVRSNSKGE